MKATGKPIGVRGAWVVWLNPEGLAAKAHRYMDGPTMLVQLGQMKGREVRPVAAPPMGRPDMKGIKGLPDEEKNVAVASALYGPAEKKSEADSIAGLGDNAVWTDLVAPKDAAGKAEIKSMFQALITAFPDAKITPERQWAVEDFVITETAMTGTQTGPLGKVKPTKKPVSVHGLDIAQIRDGKIVRVVSYGNGMELLGALDLLPKPKPVKDKPQPAKDKPPK
jgi:ketosteroid isomerase-like protein